MWNLHLKQHLQGTSNTTTSMFNLRLTACMSLLLWPDQYLKLMSGRFSLRNISISVFSGSNWFRRGVTTLPPTAGLILDSWPNIRLLPGTRYCSRKLEFFPNPSIPNIRQQFSAENFAEIVFVVTLLKAHLHPPSHQWCTLVWCT